jgi:hypothetical protein
MPHIFNSRRVNQPAPRAWALLLGLSGALTAGLAPAANLPTWQLPISSAAGQQKTLTLLGADPRVATETTEITVNVVPVVLRLISTDDNGRLRRLGSRDATAVYYRKGSDVRTAVSQVLKSPAFVSTAWSVDGPALGQGQFIDVYLKRNYGALLGNRFANKPYLKLKPRVLPAVTIESSYVGRNPGLDPGGYFSIKQDGNGKPFWRFEPDVEFRGSVAGLVAPNIIEKFTKVIESTPAIRGDALTLFVLFNTQLGFKPQSDGRTRSSAGDTFHVANERISRSAILASEPAVTAYTVKTVNGRAEKVSYVIASYNLPYPEPTASHPTLGGGRGIGQDASPVLAGLAQAALNPYSQWLTRSVAIDGTRQDPSDQGSSTASIAQGNATFCGMPSFNLWWDMLDLRAGVRVSYPRGHVSVTPAGLLQDFRTQTTPHGTWTIPNLLTLDWWAGTRLSHAQQPAVTFLPSRGGAAYGGTRYQAPCQVVPGTLPRSPSNQGG